MKTSSLQLPSLAGTLSIKSMFQSAPKHVIIILKIQKKIWGRGHSPLPDPSPAGGGHPLPHPPPSAPAAPRSSRLRRSFTHPHSEVWLRVPVTVAQTKTIQFIHTTIARTWAWICSKWLPFSSTQTWSRLCLSLMTTSTMLCYFATLSCGRMICCLHTFQQDSALHTVPCTSDDRATAAWNSEVHSSGVMSSK